MSDDGSFWRDLERLFHEAADLDDAGLQRLLAEVRRERPELAAELARLVAADRAGDSMGQWLQRFAASALAGSDLQPGERIGRYAIRYLLGRGGMGAVYLAERADDAYRQQVVVKLVDAPMAAQLAARLERERQILADLDHPNIARLIDGGALDDGTPYLIMEHVQGEPISTYCDQQDLDAGGRVELFRQVVEAVRYAHAHLVIHRDIKPDNVLVDGHGRVRLLDFGIAKLVASPHAADDPAAPAAAPPDPSASGTEHGARLLSPAYASPEQIRGDPVTTATDIHGLGSLLYRLLTGRAPHDAPRRSDDASDPPSACKTTRRLSASARRDLDAIVERAMADDPADRYGSAGALLDDLDRWRGHRPVAARRGGWIDHVAKFARRNRALAASLAVSAVVIAGSAVALGVLAVRLADERAAAVRSAATTDRIADYLVDLFAAADPASHQGETLTARELLDRGVERIRGEDDMEPVVRARLLHRMALAYRNLGLLDDAAPLYALAIAAAERSAAADVWRLRLERADLQRERGLHGEAERRLRRAIDRLERAGGRQKALAHAYNNLGIVLETTERYADAEAAARRGLMLLETLPAGREHDILRTRFRHNRAIALSGLGRYDEAIDEFERVIEAKTELLGPRHPSRLISMETLASTLREAGRFAVAGERLEASLALRREIYGPDALSLARVGNELANVHHDAGRYGEAERAYRDAMAVIEADPERDRLLHAYLVNNLGALYEDRGDLERAEPLFRRSLELRIDLSGPQSLPVVRARINLARLLIKRGALAEADELLEAAQRTLAESFPDNRYRWQAAEAQRAMLEAARGQAQSARDRMAGALAALEAMGPSAAFGLRRARFAAVRLDIDGGDPERALDRIAGIEAELPEAFSPHHPIRQILRVLRAQALAALGRAEEARRLADATAPLLAQQFADGAEIRRRAASVLAEGAGSGT